MVSGATQDCIYTPPYALALAWELIMCSSHGSSDAIAVLIVTVVVTYNYSIIILLL